MDSARAAEQGAEQGAASERGNGSQRNDTMVPDSAPSSWDPTPTADRTGPLEYDIGPLPPAQELPENVQLAPHPESFHRTKALALVAIRQHALDHGYDLIKFGGHGSEPHAKFHCYHRDSDAECPYTCRIEYEGRAQWKIKADSEEHRNHTPDHGLGLSLWRGKLTPDEEAWLDRVQADKSITTARRARSVLNVLRQRAHKPRLRDDTALQYRWCRNALASPPPPSPRTVLASSSTQQPQGIAASSPSKQQTQAVEASSPSTTAVGRPGGSLVKRPLRNGRKTAPSPFYPRKPTPPSTPTPAPVTTTSSGPLPPGATRFGTAPPLASSSRTPDDGQDNSPDASGRCYPCPAAAISHEGVAAASPLEEPSAADSLQQPADEAMSDDRLINGNHVDGVGGSSSRSASAAAAAASHQDQGERADLGESHRAADGAQQRQDEVMDERAIIEPPALEASDAMGWRDDGAGEGDHPNDDHLGDFENPPHCSPAAAAAAAVASHISSTIEQHPSEAGGQEVGDVPMDEPAPADAQSSATHGNQSRGATAAGNGAGPPPQQPNDGPNGAGDGRGAADGSGGGVGGDGGGGGRGGSGGSSTMPATSSSTSHALLLEAVQTGPYVSFVTPGDEGGVSFGRIFGPWAQWTGYETYAETTQDESKALQASSQYVDVAASSMLPGGGRLIRVTRTTWALLPRASPVGGGGG